MRCVAVIILLAACGRVGFEPLGGDGGGSGSNTDPRATRNVPGGTFLRGNDVLYPATVSAFTLDRFEVTVARFRVFVDAGFGVGANPPADKAGANPHAAGTGWDSGWNNLIEGNTTFFRTELLGAPQANFTVAPGPNENLPIVGVTWYEAFAFCIWDGGRLPTHAEMQLALVGGDEQRVYPWGSGIDDTYLAKVMIEPIGSHSPKGDGRWGHADLVGNLDEWSFDYAGGLAMTCTDCAHTTFSTTRVLQGYWFGVPDNQYRATSLLHGAGPGNRVGVVGFRCAR